MNIHEYQAKEILSAYGVPVLESAVAYSAEEAFEEATKLLTGMENPLVVVKAQIHAGGRGKAGGVILCRSADEAKAAAEKLLFKTLVTHQTGPQGQEVRRIFLERGCPIAREIYLSAVINRRTGTVSFIASPAGGMDIEEVAQHTPQQILTVSINPISGFQAFHARRLAFFLSIPADTLKTFYALTKGIYEAFTEHDASLVEINPLVITTQGDIVALDAKMSFDDNALMRQPHIEELRDLTEEDPAEAEAKKHELNYVKLDGTIGCMVNGAGLAMATMDIIKLHGGQPANFLDVGGGATAERVKEAFHIILSDPNVKAIFINIFGGIMRCDIIAQGIVAAARETNITVPLVVRLQGTNHELGKQILSGSGLAITAINDFNEAAAAAAHAAQGA